MANRDSKTRVRAVGDRSSLLFRRRGPTGRGWGDPGEVPGDVLAVGYDGMGSTPGSRRTLSRIEKLMREYKPKSAAEKLMVNGLMPRDKMKNQDDVRLASSTSMSPEEVDELFRNTTRAPKTRDTRRNNFYDPTYSAIDRKSPGYASTGGKGSGAIVTIGADEQGRGGRMFIIGGAGKGMQYGKDGKVIGHNGSANSDMAEAMRGAALEGRKFRKQQKLNKAFDEFGRKLVGENKKQWDALGDDPLAKAQFMQSLATQDYASLGKPTAAAGGVADMLWQQKKREGAVQEAQNRRDVLNGAAGGTRVAAGSVAGGPGTRPATADVSDLVPGRRTTGFSGPGGTPFRAWSYDRMGVKDAGRMRARAAAEEYAGKMYDLQQRKKEERDQDAKARFIFSNWTEIQQQERRNAILRRQRGLKLQRQNDADELVNLAMELQGGPQKAAPQQSAQQMPQQVAQSSTEPPSELPDTDEWLQKMG